MYRCVLAAAVACLMMTSVAFSQSAALTGTVTDPSKALLPGVTITVTNTDTSVTNTTISNEVGVYSFPSLQPGSAYRVSASLPGFQTITATNVALAQSITVRQNFEMQLAGGQTTVDVTVDRQGAIVEASPSVGEVLPEYKIRNLPLVGNNVLDLLNVLPGMRLSGAGDYANTVAGMGINTLNVTVDGLPVRDDRFNAQAGTFQGVDLNGNPSPAFGFFGPGVIPTYTGGNQLLATTTINPDLVGEIRLILAPVDAEMGRGNSQVQITTRSGTNKYTGSAVWNIQNTALNPNSWDRNNDVNAGTTNQECRVAGEKPPCWNPTKPDWRNTNNYSVSYGGPIIRNKTFFFVLWDQQISNTRTIQTNQVLTDTARQGIFRYWQGYNPGDADSALSAISATAANPNAPSVDFQGRPLAPPRWPNGDAYDGSQPGVPAGNLVCFSVFGNRVWDGNGGFRNFIPGLNSPDCPGGVDANGRSYNGLAIGAGGPADTLWDPKRPGADAALAGYFNSKILGLMPRANEFAEAAFGATNSGLNTASFRFLRGRHGNNNDDSIVGSEAYTNRKQINVKIDQNFSVHRISGSWTHQIDDSTDMVASWPDGLSGQTIRRPHTFTVSGTSTLSSTLLNEARFGLNLDQTKSIPAWKSDNESYAERARAFLIDGGPSRSGNGNLYPVLVSPGAYDNGVVQTSLAQQVGFSNPLYNFADTVSWTRGNHSFKFGGDFRFPHSDGFTLQPYPVVGYGNIGGTATTSTLNDQNQTGALGTTNTPTAAAGGQAYFTNLYPSTSRTAALNLEYVLTNSMGSAQTRYWAENFADTTNGVNGWQDTTTQENRNRKMVNFDYAIFAKDDFKATRNLTLNLGVRYEYYAPPYITSGLTSTIVDQGNGLFGPGRGVGGQLFDNWLQPGNLYFTGYGTNASGTGTTAATGNNGKNNGLSPTAVSLSCSQTAVGAFASRLPAPNCDPNLVSNIEFIGPNSPNTGKTIIPRDRNNFGPAVGFAYQLPWFGAGKTTIRGGYQLTYQRVSISEGQLASSLGGYREQNANSTTPSVFNIADATGLNRAVLISDTPSIVPVLPTVGPGETVPVYGRTQSFTAYDPNYVTPYTQNLTLSVTRSLNRSMTLDVRYVGNLTRKSSGSLNLNSSTALYNPELLAAFDAVRRGENPELLDLMLAGVDLAPSNTAGSLTNFFGDPTGYNTGRAYGPIGTCVSNITGAGAPPTPGTPTDGCPAGSIRQHAGDHIRRATIVGTTGPLANGDYVALANILAGNTAPSGGLQPVNIPTAGVAPQQRLLRNGCDRIANGLWDPNSPVVIPVLDSNVVANRDAIPATVNGVAGGPALAQNIPTRCFPENYLIANPQLSNATYNANLGRNNYHSLQVQFTMRPVYGTNFQGTYTLAKSMSLAGSGYTDPLQRERDHGVGSERNHTFRMNGTFELPFGPNKLLFANSSGWVARLIENWQTSLIMNLATGSGTTISGASNMRYGNARYVATEFWKTPKGDLQWNGPNGTGTFFGNTGPGIIGSMLTVPDPQCAEVTKMDPRGYLFGSGQFGCTLLALAARAPAGTPGSFLQDPTNPNSDSLVYLLVNPKQGEYGTLGANTLRGAGQFSLDANIQKRFRLTETKQLSLRIDTTNVLNHPTPGVPNFLVNTGAFGEMGQITTGKSGGRTFQGQVRLTF